MRHRAQPGSASSDHLSGCGKTCYHVFWKSDPVEAEAASKLALDRFLTADWLCCKCDADRVIAPGEP